MNSYADDNTPYVIEDGVTQLSEYLREQSGLQIIRWKQILASAI